MMNDNNIKGITVYCGASTSAAPEFTTVARELGRLIALADVPLINGAGSMGLMGAVSDAALATGGKVVGVIPRFMVERGWHHRGLTELRVTDNMHRRKALMASLSRAVIALPGGIGTLDELTEIITWRQLGLYNGNIVILNVCGYYDNLLAMLGRAVDEHFMQPDHTRLWSVADTAPQAVSLALADAPDQTFSAKFVL